MRLRLDPWPVDYEAAILFEEAATLSRAEVRTDVECETWRIIPPQPEAPGLECYFVDGVRRVEARVLSESEGGRYVHGLLGSLAAGFVKVSNGKAAFGDICVQRLLVLGGGAAEPREMHLGVSTLRFEPCSAAENAPDAVLSELQKQMRAAEERLAASLSGQGACVFVDGPSYRATSRHEVAGVVKRIVDPYLREPHFNLVEQLRQGDRTPLFSILDSKYDRYSCFLRLAAPRAMDHPLAGIVRIEIGAAAGVETARRLATFAAGMLPRFASTSVRDPRAPQNLLPVGALEQEMRRRLGDALLIRRAIERELHEQRDR
ncbi:MAG TPA: DNA double-strand break repair nuclease NurA [Bryobacteraceae bacterium]|nr:DNA double-strand break repair nuclease NurA [Bryobacteraceae bacterium]